jgi:hypothetical protein
LGLVPTVGTLAAGGIGDNPRLGRLIWYPDAGGLYGRAMDGYIVERYWPGVTEADVRLTAAALRAAGGTDVRYLGSILMPEDEVVLFQFDAVSAHRVAASGEQAGLRCDRVVSAVFLDEQDLDL